MSTPTFYWHDYETWGADPSRDRASQFAGIRTDWDLNVIGEPLMVYAKPPMDMLPSPEACLITGVTPQRAHAEGVSEAEFIRLVHDQLAAPGTCGVGYNSIRFDDEITRFTFYRNFYDAYAREWQNGNSRWDIIDVVRLCYALRPEGIEWPMQVIEEPAAGGPIQRPSFRLEELTVANGIAHEAAHDALSDVYATIAMAKLIKSKQPKLFDFALNLRKKQAVNEQLNIVSQKPVVHISAMYPATQGCAAVVMPLAYHPTNKNGVIVYDLSLDPSELLSLSAEEIKHRLYTPRAELPEGVARIALKNVHVNKSPMVVPVSLMDESVAKRLNIDLAACRRHYDQLQSDRGAAKALYEKLQVVFTRDYSAEGDVEQDAELSLYGGGFFGSQDKHAMTQVRQADAQALASQSFVFEDARLNELLFRYKARNYPQSLSPQEQQRWQEFRQRRLHEGCGGQTHSLASLAESIEQQRQIYHLDPLKMQILAELEQWAVYLARV
jgi:exodeoxyribonuclease-1